MRSTRNDEQRRLVAAAGRLLRPILGLPTGPIATGLLQLCFPFALGSYPGLKYRRLYLVRRHREHLDLPTVTGLVFDLPHAPWIGDVMRLRAAYDPVRLRFPVEITVVGSSGLGWFSEGISRRELAHKIQAIAQAFSPFRFRFGGVTCFPGSTVYYMAPADGAPFHDFQRRIAACGLSFQPTAFSYTPHCTIAELSDDAASSASNELMEFRVPEHDIHVGSVSIYTLETEARKCYQHERIAIGV